MQLTRVFRNFFIGKKRFIASRAEFKRVMLTGYLSLLCVVANWAYLIVNNDDRLLNSILNGVFCFVGITSLLLLRFGRYTAAKLLLFIGAYLIVFIFCSFEPFETGVSIYFVVCSIGALALFGYEQKHFGFLFAGCGAFLFSLAYLLPIEIPKPSLTFSEAYIHGNFLLNFFVSLGASILILFFMTDVNRYSEKTLEKKEAEAQERNKELTKLNAELDRFVYSVSHDLRSPLATITGIVNIGKYAENMDEARKYFAMIENRLKAQDFFIREIIDFYRNSRTEINREPIHLQEEVQSIVNDHSYVENLNSIDYQVAISPDIELKSDKIRLRSVLTNLIGNAVKYHDLSKPERFIRVGAERNNGHVEIMVEDNGQGIGQEHLNKIFDMFYRASTDSKGSGLGLFIAQETATKLGGKICVQSTLGKGSKFSITIPAEA
jgi:signal transduction histidine kinase